MSTGKPPRKHEDRPQVPGSASRSRAGQKGKSKGFIESTGYKPSWLETGPLTPDMLPATSTVETASTVDEYAALQEALQRFYGHEPVEEAEPIQPVEEVEPIEPEPVEEPEAVPDRPAEAAPAAEAAMVDPLPLAAVIEPVPAVVAVTSEVPAPVEPESALMDAAAPMVEELPRSVEPSAIEDETLFEAAAATLILPELDLETLEPMAIPVVADVMEEPLAAAPPFAVPPAGAQLPDAQLFEIQPLDDLPLDALPLDAPSLVEAPDDPIDEEVRESPVDVPEAPPPADYQVAPLLDEPEPGVVSEAPPVARRSRRATRTGPSRPRSRLSVGVITLSVLLLAMAAAIYFVNPFTRLALETASLARPISSPVAAPPRQASGDWCLQGDFLAGAAGPALTDNGRNGDILAGDRVFALEYPVATPGSFTWQVADCKDPSIVYPREAAWAMTGRANQPVTFFFDSDERSDPLFFPIPYAVSALDSAVEYRVVGSFQDWDATDPSGVLEQINNGLYQQVRRIARSGSYEAYAIAGDGGQAIDAYGRTTKPIPFAFETRRNGDYVVFLVDIDRGRASVLYDMSPLVTRLAFGGGYWLLSSALAGLALLLLLLALARELTLRNRRLWMDAGCPRCHEHELVRIARRRQDHLLHRLAIPAYRYRCRNCTWEGTRLSDTGRSVSPGAPMAKVEGIG